MRAENRIDYIEIPATDLPRARAFLVGTISQAIFPFPGGRRFHFIDPVGTEYAIWSESQ